MKDQSGDINGNISRDSPLTSVLLCVEFTHLSHEIRFCHVDQSGETGTVQSEPSS